VCFCLFRLFEFCVTWVEMGLWMRLEIDLWVGGRIGVVGNGLDWVSEMLRFGV